MWEDRFGNEVKNPSQVDIVRGYVKQRVIEPITSGPVLSQEERQRRLDAIAAGRSPGGSVDKSRVPMKDGDMTANTAPQWGTLKAAGIKSGDLVMYHGGNREALKTEGRLLRVQNGGGGWYDYVDPETGAKVDGGGVSSKRWFAKVPEFSTPKVGQPTTVGATPKVTGYVKGREIRPGMVINAADLLPMHERQGSTTGENPNPRGHQEWIRVGMIGNSNTPGFKEYEGGGTLTGGMYIVVDQSGRPVGRMSANTIAETSTDVPVVSAAQINQVRMMVKGKDKRTGQTIEVPTVVGVPSKHAQEELGLPAPRFLREGVLDPADPNYGLNADHPEPTKRPFGGRVQGARTREEAAADRTRRREIYASGEEERARRLAEEKAAKKVADMAEQARLREESDRRMAEDRERRRRQWLQERHREMTTIITNGGQKDFDWRTNEETFNPDVDSLLRKGVGRYGESGVNNLARAYGVKWRGKTRAEKEAGIIAAVKAGKTPDEEVDAPKVKAPVDEAAKATAAAKRRRSAIAKNFDEIKTYLDTGDDDNASFHLRVIMSDNAVTQLAKAFGFEELHGGALKAALFEAIRAGRTPDLDTV